VATAAWRRADAVAAKEVGMEAGAFAVSGGDARCGTHRAAAAAAAAVMTRETEQTVGVWTGGGELSPADGKGQGQ